MKYPPDLFKQGRPVYNAVALFLAGILLFLCSCGSGSSSHPPAAPSQPAMATGLKDKLEQRFGCSALYVSNLASDSTFTTVYVGSPGSPQVPFFYSADTALNIYAGLYRLRADSMIPVSIRRIYRLESTYLQIDSTSPRYLQIGREPYFYFAANETFEGKAVPEQHVSFYLINLNELKDYSITYTGMPDFKCEECIVGTFGTSDLQRQHPALYDSLLAFSARSYMIYHPTAVDEDAYSYLNYETKWTTDNKADNTFGAGYWEIEKPLRTTYYTTDLFEKNKGTVTDSLENDRYLIRSYFRSNLIGYDKSKRLYFPVIVEGCNYSCTKDIEFIAPDVLTITHEDSEYTDTLSLSADLIFDTITGK